MGRIVERRRLFWGAWLSMGLLICVGSLMPIQNIPLSSGLMSDKAMHAIAYFLLGMSALMGEIVWQRGLRLVLISFLMGALIEIIQPLTGRFFEFYDILANSLGLLLAIFLYLCGALIIKKIRPDRTSI